MKVFCRTAACLALVLAGGCASNSDFDEHLGSHNCPECGKAWLGSINQADNGYGSRHYMDQIRVLRDLRADNKISGVEAERQIRVLNGSRDHLWHDYELGLVH